MFSTSLRAIAPRAHAVRRPATRCACSPRPVPSPSRRVGAASHSRSLSAAATAQAPQAPEEAETACADREPVENRPRPSEKEAGARMRDVLRSVAQPVVVAVARTHGTCSAPFHGATLTSFASLTLEPHPLVAFSLRLPSRMADLLRPCTSPSPAPIQLTMSLLAGVDQPIADALAKPGKDQGPIFTAPQWDNANPPALVDAVGNLRCEVVHCIPLRDVGGDTTVDAPGSELFICKVVDAVRGTGKDSLVHYQREYYSVSSHDHDQ